MNSRQRTIIGLMATTAWSEMPFVTRHKETQQVGLTLEEQMEREAWKKYNREVMLAEREQKKIERAARKRARQTKPIEEH